MDRFNDWIWIIENNNFGKIFNYLLIDEKNLLFDISSIKTSRDIKEFPPNYLIISHFHLDHQTGKLHLKKKFQTEIYAHYSEADSIESINGFSKNYNIFNGIQLINQLHLKFWRFEECSIDLKLDDGKIIDLGDHKLKIIHTPGTTPGHICLFDLDSKILFAGDMGPLELPVYNAITSSVSQYLKSYDKIMHLKPEIVLSAHFPPIQENIIEKYKRAIERINNREIQILEIIRKRKRITIDEIVKEKPTIKRIPNNPLLKEWMEFSERVQTLHHLNKLKSENKIYQDNQNYWYEI